jgi:hypothetical protein
MDVIRIGQGIEKTACDPRFSDPRLAGQQNHLPFACSRLPPAIDQQGQLLLPADHIGNPAGALRVEAALDKPLATDRICTGGTGDPLQRLLAQVGEFEETAKQAPGRFRDHQLPRLGKPLQPGREVRRLADHRFLLRGPVADQVAHDHQAGGDTGTRRQWLATRRRDT